MKFPFTKTLPSLLALLALIVGALGVTPVHASTTLFVSEVAAWSSSVAPLSSDWFEVTNTGASAVNMSGWKVDDSSNAFASAVTLNGITSIAPGESVIFIENATPATAISNFTSVWFNGSAPVGLQIGTYTGSGIGLSGTADAVNLFDSSGVLQASVTFGASSSSAPFASFDNAAGLDNTSISQLSVVGTNGAFVALNDSNQTGSPGSIANAPASNTAPSITGLAVGASGVLGDATTPIFSGASGFTFSVSDAEDAPSALSVEILNNAPALVTATLVTVNASLGQYRLDFSAPLSASGIATITVTVTDSGLLTGTDTFQYGASAHDATRPNALYHTHAADASTVFALDANYMVVGNDEDQVLRVYERSTSGAPVTETDLTSALNLTDISGGVPREVDVEGSAFNGSTLYIIGSHDNHSGGNPRPNRSRLFGVTVNGTGAATSFTSTGYYEFLKADLIAWDNGNDHGLGAGYFGIEDSAAAGVIPEQLSGFNIEGLTFAPGSSTTLYVGFRAPLEPTTSRTMGLIVPVTNATTLMGASSGSAVFGAPIQLNLGGRGIRSIECNASGCFIMAGNATSGGNFALFRWTGNAVDAPVLTDTDLSNGSSYTPGLAPEGIIIPADVNQIGATLQAVSDNGDTIWYNNGIIAKDLAIDAHKKYRSDLITVGADVSITPTPTITQTPSKTPTITPTLPATSGLVISEVAAWSSSSLVSADWFEVTNTSGSPVNMSGWKVDDSSNSFAAALTLNGISSIAPGESVIFLESATPASSIATFQSIWFDVNVPAGLQVGSYTGSGIGLSSSGDAVNLFNGSGDLQASVSFGASPASPYASFDNAAGLNNTTISQLSVVGVNGAFVAVNDSNETGSPGTIVNAATPTPTLTATVTATVTNTFAPTSTETVTATSTSTPSATAIATFTRTSTATFTKTPTRTLTRTATKTATRTATRTPTSTATPVTVTLNSIAAQDGWVLESTETSSVGGTLQNAGALVVGDDSTNKQYRSLLSFNTQSLPDTATITGLMFKIKQQAIIGGGNPFTFFNGLMFDIKNGFFGPTADLQLADFQAAASGVYGPSLTPSFVNNVYTFNLINAISHINKLASNSGVTQIRLRFVLDDNNNEIANYLNLYSGNATATDRPQLVITYTLP